MPDSGIAAAIGYSQQKKIDFDLGLFEITMLEEHLFNQNKLEDLAVKMKLNANKSSIKVSP